MSISARLLWPRFKTEGWFEIDRAIKNEKGRANDAVTRFNWVASTTSDDEARASLVVARPKTGRWHQIRRHLNGLSHPILGDSSHGNTDTNKDWRTNRGLPGARLALHCCRLEVPATDFTPPLDVSCPLPDELMWVIQNHMGGVVDDAACAEFLKREANIDFGRDARLETADPPAPEIADSPLRKR